MTFFEETIGESQIRKIYFTVTLLVGVFVLFALFIYYEIISGLLLAYKEHKSSNVGKLLNTKTGKNRASSDLYKSMKASYLFV
jgi:hypothetical protein